MGPMFYMLDYQRVKIMLREVVPPPSYGDVGLVSPIWLGIANTKANSYDML
jgi:hypothetical protein